MKKTALSFLFVLSLIASHATRADIQNDEPPKLLITHFTVKGIQTKGDFAYRIDCDAVSFNSTSLKHPERNAKPAMENEGPIPMTVPTFEIDLDLTALKGKKCAISYVVDENGDNHTNYNWLGIPTEGTGTSGINYRPLKKPKWENAYFEVDSTREMTLNTYYY